MTSHCLSAIDNSGCERCQVGDREKTRKENIYKNESNGTNRGAYGGTSRSAAATLPGRTQVKLLKILEVAYSASKRAGLGYGTQIAFLFK